MIRNDNFSEGKFSWILSIVDQNGKRVEVLLSEELGQPKDGDTKK